MQDLNKVSSYDFQGFQVETVRRQLLAGANRIAYGKGV